MSTAPGMAGAVAGAVTTMAMVANAIKACGTLVKVEPNEFLQIITMQEKPLVVRAQGGIFTTYYRYLTSYKGLAFHCKSPTELPLPTNIEMISAKKISIPDI